MKNKSLYQRKSIVLVISLSLFFCAALVVNKSKKETKTKEQKILEIYALQKTEQSIDYLFKQQLEISKKQIDNIRQQNKELYDKFPGKIAQQIENAGKVFLIKC